MRFSLEIEGRHYIMPGFVIGAAAGAVQFWILSKFTGAVIRGRFGNKTVLFAIVQFLLPFIVLLGCAFLLPGSLLWAGVGIAASLTISALIRFLITIRSER